MNSALNSSTGLTLTINSHRDGWVVVDRDKDRALEKEKAMEVAGVAVVLAGDKLTY